MSKILFEQFQKTDKFKRVVENYRDGKRQLIQGVNEESMAFLVCNLLDCAAD